MERTMEFSIREVKARFAEAAAAAVRGERVVVTKHGRPFVELVPAQRASGMDFEKAAVVRRELGLGSLKVSLPSSFDDPAFSTTSPATRSPNSTGKPAAPVATLGPDGATVQSYAKFDRLGSVVSLADTGAALRNPVSYLAYG